MSIDHTIFAEPFSEDIIPLFADFSCGEIDFEKEIHEWIKNDTRDCVVDDMEKFPDMEVWVYGLSDGTIIGFGALSRIEWLLPATERGKSKWPISYIANVGIASRFQGGPYVNDQKLENPRERYSGQIMDHLLGKAKEKTDREPYLGLHVHPANKGAKRLYAKFGFMEMTKNKLRHPVFGIDYPAMIKNLSES